MHTFLLIPAILASLATTLPTSDTAQKGSRIFPSHTDTAQKGPGVYMSSEPFWGFRETKGTWQWIEITPGKCQELTDFDKVISSFGPDKGVQCLLYDQHSCKGKQLEIFYPGYADMSWNGWDNRVSSFTCSSS
ncbi:hypothetical protein BCR34DRAFT_596884 [Clohesyomyces aquaticus]|uniref:Beta/gamma crystallin 'Greek key' domain-containing protein n=1 Tax=Clohesyomyces aquaticus TaxID=1231657 RepID=A0A1Y2A4G5_9PLEO|nr:hypothetical protein BCR34DRAFT_596884 [Clohesyomyces aquaticus]